MVRLLSLFLLGTSCTILTGALNARCGDGFVSTSEDCDDGNANSGDGCDATCSIEPGSCGNGILDDQEDCDDGNNTASDGCDESCQLEVCSDGVISAEEECDDGNSANSDGCGDDCTIEAGFVCAGEPSTCQPEAICGDGILNDSEECDDKNVLDGDDCSARCITEIDVIQITAGTNYTCARLSDESLRCWGSSSEGQLGNGSTDDIGDDEFLFDVAPLVSSASSAVEAGDLHTCALFSGSVRCWGNNSAGQLGKGDLINFGGSPNETPAAAANIINLGVITKLAMGGKHSCALGNDDSIRCWGENSSGQLGTGNITDLLVPSSTAITFIGTAPLDITAGLAHTCGLDSAGVVFCWGENSSGQLGAGNNSNLTAPITPVSLTDIASQITAGDSHTCALLGSGDVSCWGNGAKGRLGYGNENNIGDDEPVSLAGLVPLSAAIAQISAGAEHTCALLAGGGVQCWGNGADGRLGNGSINDVGDNDTAAGTAGTLLSFGGQQGIQVAAGGAHTCILFDDGNIRCWGNGSDGQLGYGAILSIVDAVQSSGIVPLF